MTQNTVAQKRTLNGVGLHSGKNINLTIAPAPENSGIVFVRTDIENGNNIAIMAKKWPAASIARARASEIFFRSIKAAETASGQPIPGLTPWYTPEKITAHQRAVIDITSSAI